MDGDYPLTLQAAATQLGVSEKTLRRRLQRPDRGGLDAIRVATPQGYTWRVRLVTPVRAAGEDTGPDSPAAVRVVNAGPPGQAGDIDRALSTLRDIVVEQQRRLEAAAEERGRLRAELVALRQRQSWWGRLRGILSRTTE